MYESTHVYKYTLTKGIDIFLKKRKFKNTNLSIIFFFCLMVDQFLQEPYISRLIL